MKKRTVKFLTGLQIEASLADNIIETGCIVPIFSRLLFETNVTKIISKNVLEKSSEKTLFFCLYFTWLCGSWKLKRIWKISHFENMTDGLLQRNQISLRWEICLICHWNIDSWKQKMFFRYVMDPKNN